jgi:hypothetical protein
VLRSADFNDGTFSGFYTDAGNFTVSGGALSVAADAVGKDSLSVFYVDSYVSTYFEIAATISVAKPVGGWKANSYVIFDYQSKYDFKFAGIDVSTNKFVLGHRTTAGWIVDSQSPLQVKPDTAYDMLIQINGTSVTVNIGGKSFTYMFGPRVIDGISYGLNHGMVGVGSDSAKGTFDNLAVQVLGPQITLDSTENYSGTSAGLFTPAAGTWTLATDAAAPTNARYTATVSGAAPAISTYTLPKPISSSSYLELQASVRSIGLGGIVFDYYSPTDFKFVVLDVPGKRVLVGHSDPTRGWTVDTAIAWSTLTAGTDYALVLTLKGASVAVSVNGSYVTTWGYNSAVADGKAGTIGRSGTTTFDWFRLKTNDPAYAAPAAKLVVSASAPAVPIGLATTPVDADRLAAAAAAARSYWTAQLAGDTGRLARLDAATFTVADLEPGTLGLTQGENVFIDTDAAGYGWIGAGSAYGVDLLAVVIHELGHVLGFQHSDAATRPEMADTVLPTVAPAAVVVPPAPPVVVAAPPEPPPSEIIVLPLLTKPTAPAAVPAKKATTAKKAKKKPKRKPVRKASRARSRRR